MGNLFFSIELVAGELIFLYAAPKRKYFLLRFLSAAAICFVISYFFPRIPASTRLMSVFTSLFRFLTLFAFTIVVMAFSFKLRFSSLFSNCVAGYAAQHIAHQAMTFCLTFTPLFAEYDGILTRARLVEIVVTVLVYIVLFLIFGRFVARNQCYNNNDRRFVWLSVGIIFICIGLRRFSVLIGESGGATMTPVYAMICCVLALIIQFNLYETSALENENRAIRLLWQKEKQQYEISKGTVELLNIKYHDMKRRLAAPERLSEQEREDMKELLAQYDGCTYRTGNEVLDVILTENSLRHRTDGVEITFMGNGDVLSFMSVTDIYSLFGNALENAIDAVSKLQEKEKKIIAVSIEPKGEMLFVSVTNYFDGTFVCRNGLPVTSKVGEEGFHGFGLKSIRLIAEKYNGGMKVSTEGDIFRLNVWLTRKN